MLFSKERQLCAPCKHKAEVLKFALEHAGYKVLRMSQSRKSWQVFYEMKK